MHQVEPQPFISATERLLDALDYVGAPLKAEDEASIRALFKEDDGDLSVDGIQF
ncbi:MAG: hypothetical protein P8L44_00330 [Opitutales bacterium]|nr:hypothetical protein [Opitutales bacterium]